MYGKLILGMALAVSLNADELSNKIEDTANMIVNKVVEDNVIASVIHSDLGWGARVELPYLHSITNVESMPLVVSLTYSATNIGIDINAKKYHDTSIFGLFYGAGLQHIFGDKFASIPHVDIGYRTLIKKDIHLDASYNFGYDWSCSGIYPYNIYSNVTTAVSYRF